MERKSSAWKVNRGMAQTNLIPVPAQIGEWTKRVQRHLNADVLGLDWIESNEGEWRCLESNDVPGLSGWPDDVRRALVGYIRNKLSHR